MAALLTLGKWVRVKCAQEKCHTEFRYKKTWTHSRKYCEDCARKRTAKSKQEFEKVKKTGVVRDPEDVESGRLLRQIPDAVNWHSLLTRVSAECF
jgi:hypothetical protein